MNATSVIWVPGLRRPGRLARLFELPREVLVFRVNQRLMLIWLRITGGWARLDRSVAGRWRVVASATALLDAPPGVLAADVDLARLQPFEPASLRLFGRPPPAGRHPTWCADERHDQTWPARYFESFDHYAPRSRPFDIKVPWELSRLGWLIPILQQGVIRHEAAALGRIEGLLSDWQHSNPLAYSCNWHPMEASMRLVTLALLLDMLRLARGRGLAVASSLAARLGHLIESHAWFVWRNREYTDVRGNHYAANLVGLLAAGAVLRPILPAAEAWFAFAAAEVEHEVPSQFLDDGVNQEMAVGYHRLVAELFLLAALIRQRAGQPLPEAVLARLRLAFEVLATIRRPDGLAPNIGDNDDARTLWFDAGEPRDHASLLDLAARALGMPLDREVPGPSNATVWLLGSEAARPRRASRPPARLIHLPAGGLVVLRTARVFAVVDVGEVGLRGRGGHGHNDIASFELCLDGRPLVIDPGCPVYTGDLATKDRFRSSAMHNGLTVDEAEIAPLLGVWRIENSARPIDVRTLEADGRIGLVVGHTGYERLDDPVVHHREISLGPAGFVCIDRLTAGRSHRVVRRLHLDAGVTAGIEGSRCVRLGTGGLVYRLEVEDGAAITLEDGEVSPGYGRVEPSQVVRLHSVTHGGAQLRISIRPEGAEP